MKKVTFNPPRPTIYDQGFVEQTVHEFIKKYYPDYYDEKDTVEEQYRNGIYYALINEFGLYDDPEYLMKILIRDYSWDFSADTWDKLQHFDFFVINKIKEKEQQWVKDNDIRPPFPVGSKVRMGACHGETEGIIDRIYEYEPARYCVMTEKQVQYNKKMESLGKTERQGGWILKFEDVELIED
ncbi:hypothetical protein [Aggregatibacter actinomycetemcomitans]|uniref:hypothetical protein n=1 Tax=Aggregatibacter actinomycetemcomitans TaxID=714 RepID=UPI00023FEF19|nr:hypothetical protein [Aggregatibacter actinomycetemcomitans]EHK89845.1 hypothetical protein RHAA1_10926 [Aggregatibacter actinomycetemcomitans RhAA1]KNE76938.1 hypothetical protein RHAA2_11235 [Aggregatibacter actinomycetemcomitans RhAA1]